MHPTALNPFFWGSPSLHSVLHFPNNIPIYFSALWILAKIWIKLNKMIIQELSLGVLNANVIKW